MASETKEKQQSLDRQLGKGTILEHHLSVVRVLLEMIL